ncbi:adenosylcobinamide-GDP ribazoletransferase [Nonomuraea sp. NPDC049152]|uniref:adenosylcobinamide-GDP ribazoletransferase n=1 Tax=Nonomuraea sp. NPDC049152 TaxID=3154350 RepID=UPI0033D82BA8
MTGWADGARFAVGTLSVFPVRVDRVDREVAGQAMVLAPLVGLALGAVSCLPLALPGSELLGAALALGLLALLTRGLHLDGLADLADGLGSGRPATQALDVMKKSDIGPFGVVTLVLTLIVQCAALAEAGPVALVAACVTGRLALTWACTRGVRSARPGGLGDMVAGTVRRGTALVATLVVLVAAVLVGAGVGQGVAGPAGGFVLPLAVLAGLGAAMGLLAHAVRRLGGVTGDVLGALVETAATAVLVVCAVVS